MNIVLPFKPFTLDEVKDITGIRSVCLDSWINPRGEQSPLLPLCRSEVGTPDGLDWMQMWAVFVAWRYLEEGAGAERAEGVLALLARMEEGHLLAAFQAGRTFAAPACQLRQLGQRVRYGMLIEPPKGRLGQRLNLRKLWAEFNSNVKRLFPTHEAKE